MNPEAITIEDCLDMFYKKNQYTICNDGKVLGFDKEKIPATDPK